MASPDPRTLRRLDRWVGVPLCFLAGLASRLRRPRPVDPGGRVLYIALAEMGSIVLAAPAIRAAARVHGATPVFVTLDQTRPVFDFLGGEFAREVHVLRTGGILAFCADLWRFARRMRASGVAIAVDLDPGARSSALIALLSGAPRRVGFAGPGLPYRGAFFTHAVPCQGDRHMSDNFAALVRATPLAEGVVALPPPAPVHRPPPAPLLLIHANGSDPVPQRRWPRDRYVELCRALLAETPDLAIVIVGGAAERSDAAALCAAVDDARCTSVAGAIAIAELPALFGRATLFVGSDSGPAHFAAHAGLPVVALFGPETPRRYQPVGDSVALYAGLPCSPCLSARNQRASRCRDARCMTAIDVREVLDAVRPHLQPVRQAARA